MNMLPDIFSNYTTRFIVEGQFTTSHATIEEAMEAQRLRGTFYSSRIKIEISYYLDGDT